MAKFNLQVANLDFTNWQSNLATAVIIFISWSFAPFSYAVSVSGTHFNTHMGMLFLYELLLAFSLVLQLNNHFQSQLADLLIIISGFCVVFGFVTAPLVMLLLLLLPIFMFLMQFSQLNLQNEAGLLTFGALLMLTIPIGNAYASLHFISWEIVLYLLPIMTSTWCFLTPFFLPRSKKRNWLLLGTLLFLIISLFTHPINRLTIVAIILTLGWWLFTLDKRLAEPSLILTSLVQMLIIVLIYWN